MRALKRNQETVVRHNLIKLVIVVGLSMGLTACVWLYRLPSSPERVTEVLSENIRNQNHGTELNYTIVLLERSPNSLPDREIWCAIITPSLEYTDFLGSMLELDHFLVIQEFGWWRVQGYEFDNSQNWTSQGCGDW
jgi:hypothetical protein